MKLRLATALASAMMLGTSLFGQGWGAAPIPPSPAQLVARLTILLSLDSAQQASATTYFTTAEKELAGLQTSLATAKKALTTAVEANNAANIAAASAQIGTLTGQEALALATAEAEFYATLTPEQQAKLVQLLAGGFGGFGHFGSGPGAPIGHSGR